MARVLLTGAAGMLGSALYRALARDAGGTHDVTALSRARFDIASARWAELPVHGHDWVINAAGLINRRQAPDADFWTVNAVFPHVLAELCAHAGAKLIHVSTDCVFDGRTGPFHEDEAAGADDLYGQTKRIGEPPGAMTIRTSIIGPELARFQNLLCWTLRQQVIHGFTNHLWNGVTTPELARCIDQIVREDAFVRGVRHIYARDISKADLIGSICRAYGHAAEIMPVEAPEGCDRRLRTRFPAWLQRLDLSPLEEQIAVLPSLTTADGAWRSPARSDQR